MTMDPIATATQTSRQVHAATACAVVGALIVLAYTAGYRTGFRDR